VGFSGFGAGVNFAAVSLAASFTLFSGAFDGAVPSFSVEEAIVAFVSAIPAAFVLSLGEVCAAVTFAALDAEDVLLAAFGELACVALDGEAVDPGPSFLTTALSVFAVVAFGICEVLLLPEAGFFAFATLHTLLILTLGQMNLLTLPVNVVLLQDKLFLRNRISTKRVISLADGAVATYMSLTDRSATTSDTAELIATMIEPRNWPA